MVVALLALTSQLARTSLELNGYRSRRVRTSAGKVHVLDARGHGHLPPVVLLHGISSAAVHFLPLLYRLRGRVRRLIAPDMPAHGFSDRPNVMRAETLKDGVVEALDAVIDEPAVLFGNSMGGVAAVHYALTRPERVRGLILCSPGGAAMDERELRRFVDTFALDTHRAALEFVDRLFSRRSRLRHVFAWGVRRQFQNPDVRELLATTSPADLLRPEQLSALRMPVLLIWGKDDRILPRPHLDYFRRHLPEHARIEEPEGFGHAPYLDDADSVAHRILAFAADVHELAPAPSISRLRRLRAA
jgi:pimeloyl-ACP methyl ester carboxylesterase